MNPFEFIESEENLTITLHDKKYAVKKAGKGPPCLLICLGSPSFRTLPPAFTEIFTVYSSDVYWTKTTSSIPPETLNLEKILEDIKILAEALELKQFFIFAHSAYGLIALEFAKKYPELALGIMMIGSPLSITLEAQAVHQNIFEAQADEPRKNIDRERRAELAQENLTQLTHEQRWLREYIYRDAPRYWHIPDFDCTALWKNISLDSTFTKLFEDVLPKLNTFDGLEKIQAPIFCAAGMSDYDCCPWLWESVKNLPTHFTFCTFEQSGHWPHYEEPERFIEHIKTWLLNLQPISSAEGHSRNRLLCDH